MEDPHTRYSKRLVSNSLLALLNTCFMFTMQVFCSRCVRMKLPPALKPTKHGVLYHVYLIRVVHCPLAHCVTTVVLLLLCLDPDKGNELVQTLSSRESQVHCLTCDSICAVTLFHLLAVVSPCCKVINTLLSDSPLFSGMDILLIVVVSFVLIAMYIYIL